MPKFYGAGTEIRLFVTDLEPSITSKPVIKSGEELKRNIRAAEEGFLNGRELSERVLYCSKDTHHLHFLGKNNNIPFFMVQAHEPLIKRSPKERALGILQRLGGSETQSRYDPVPSPILEKKTFRKSLSGPKSLSGGGALTHNYPKKIVEEPLATKCVKYGPWDSTRQSDKLRITDSIKQSSDALNLTVGVTPPTKHSAKTDVSFEKSTPSEWLRHRKSDSRQDPAWKTPNRLSGSISKYSVPETIESEDEIAKLPPSPALVRPSTNPCASGQILKALALRVTLSNECCKLYSDVMIDVFFNGRLSNSTLIPGRIMRVLEERGKTTSHNFAGTRVHRLQEAPWIISSPQTRNRATFATALGPDALRSEVETRWNEVNAALNVEAAALRYDSIYGDLQPVEDYLSSLASLEVPENIIEAQISHGPRYGVIDVVVSLGKGKKFGVAAGYLTKPQRLFCNSSQNEVHYANYNHSAISNLNGVEPSSRKATSVTLSQTQSTNNLTNPAIFLQEEKDIPEIHILRKWNRIQDSDPCLSPNTAQSRSEGFKMHPGRRRAHSTGGLRIPTSVPAADEFRRNLGFLDAAMIHSPPERNRESIDPRAAQIHFPPIENHFKASDFPTLISEKTSLNNGDSIEDELFISINSILPDPERLNVTDSAGNVKFTPKEQTAAVNKLNRSICCDERPTKRYRTSVSPKVAETFSSQYFSDANAERRTIKGQISSESSLQQPGSMIDIIEEDSEAMNHVNNLENAKVLATKEGFGKSTAWLLKRINANEGQVVQEEPRAGLSEMRPLSSIALSSETNKLNPSRHHPTIESLGAARGKFDHSAASNTQDGSSMILCPALDSEENVVGERRLIQTQTPKHGVVKHQLSDKRHANNKLKLPRADNFPNEKSTQFIVPEESKNCVITYPDEFDHSPMKQSEVPIRRQIRAERGGNFQGETVLMGVRFIVGSGAGFP